MSKSSKRLGSFVSLFGIVCGFAQISSAAHAQEGLVAVIANGTGCPAGTWDTQIGADGLSVTATFTGFHAAVDANRSFDTKNCQFGLELSNTEDYAYAVQSATFTGSASLAAGVSAQLSTQAYIAGNPADGTSASTALAAPYAGDFSTTIALDDDLTWTSCGPAYDLNFNTRVVLRKNAGSASYVDLNAGEGITLQLIKRGC